MHACMLICSGRVQLFVALSTVAHHCPLSIGFSRSEDWNGLPCPPPGDLPYPGIKYTFPKFPTMAGRSYTTSTTWEVLCRIYIYMLKTILGEQLVSYV